MNKIVTAIAAVGIAIITATPAQAGQSYSASLHVPGDRDQLIGCIAWENVYQGTNIACTDNWRYLLFRVTLDDGTSFGSGRNDGPGADQATQISPDSFCAIDGAVKITIAVGDLDRKNGWEGRATYRC